ncbi:MAG TPA: DUF697 domain-containing protein [Ramlibacter sp.]|jgi:uncharacterized protein (DUF697 family)
MPEASITVYAETRPERAERIVRRNMWWSAGAGLLPIPLVEFAAITAVQVKVINELANLYETPFRKDAAKAAVVSLIGGLGSVALGKTVAWSALRYVPIVGLPVAALSLSGVAAGITWAVGKVFTAHFELGGTMLDFDAEKMREHFKQEFANGVSQATAAVSRATGGSPSATK